jgi:hypothetical protein
VTKPLLLKALGLCVALLVITAGIVYFVQTEPSVKTLLTVGAIAAPSASVTPSASPSPAVSVAPSEPSVQVQTPVATTKAPPPKQPNIVISDVSLTCVSTGPPSKLRLSATVSTNVMLHMVTTKTNIDGFIGTVIIPWILAETSRQIDMEGSAPSEFQWSITAQVENASGQLSDWSKTMPSQKNPCVG